MLHAVIAAQNSGRKLNAKPTYLLEDDHPLSTTSSTSSNNNSSTFASDNLDNANDVMDFATLLSGKDSSSLSRKGSIHSSCGSALGGMNPTLLSLTANSASTAGSSNLDSRHSAFGGSGSNLSVATLSSSSSGNTSSTTTSPNTTLPSAASNHDSTLVQSAPTSLYTYTSIGSECKALKDQLNVNFVFYKGDYDVIMKEVPQFQRLFTAKPINWFSINTKNEAKTNYSFLENRCDIYPCLDRATFSSSILKSKNPLIVMRLFEVKNPQTKEGKFIPIYRTNTGPGSSSSFVNKRSNSITSQTDSFHSNSSSGSNLGGSFSSNVESSFTSTTSSPNNHFNPSSSSFSSSSSSQQQQDEEINHEHDMNGPFHYSSYVFCKKTNPKYFEPFHIDASHVENFDHLYLYIYVYNVNYKSSKYELEEQPVLIGYYKFTDQDSLMNFEKMKLIELYKTKSSLSSPSGDSSSLLNHSFSNINNNINLNNNNRIITSRTNVLAVIPDLKMSKPEKNNIKMSIIFFISSIPHSHLLQILFLWKQFMLKNVSMMELLEQVKKKITYKECVLHAHNLFKSLFSILEFYDEHEDIRNKTLEILFYLIGQYFSKTEQLFEQIVSKIPISEKVYQSILKHLNDRFQESITSLESILKELNVPTTTISSANTISTISTTNNNASSNSNGNSTITTTRTSTNSNSSTNSSSTHRRNSLGGRSSSSSTSSPLNSTNTTSATTSATIPESHYKSLYHAIQSFSLVMILLKKRHFSKKKKSFLVPSKKEKHLKEISEFKEQFHSLVAKLLAIFNLDGKNVPNIAIIKGNLMKSLTVSVFDILHDMLPHHHFSNFLKSLFESITTITLTEKFNVYSNVLKCKCFIQLSSHYHLTTMTTTTTLDASNPTTTTTTSPSGGSPSGIQSGTTSPMIHRSGSSNSNSSNNNSSNTTTTTTTSGGGFNSPPQTSLQHNHRYEMIDSIILKILFPMIRENLKTHSSATTSGGIQSGGVETHMNTTTTTTTTHASQQSYKHYLTLLTQISRLFEMMLLHVLSVEKEEKGIDIPTPLIILFEQLCQFGPTLYHLDMSLANESKKYLKEMSNVNSDLLSKSKISFDQLYTNNLELRKKIYSIYYVIIYWCSTVKNFELFNQTMKIDSNTRENIISIILTMINCTLNGGEFGDKSCAVVNPLVSEIEMFRPFHKKRVKDIFGFLQYLQKLEQFNNLNTVIVVDCNLLIESLCLASFSSILETETRITIFRNMIEYSTTHMERQQSPPKNLSNPLNLQKFIEILFLIFSSPPSLKQNNSSKNSLLTEWSEFVCKRLFSKIKNSIPNLEEFFTKLFENCVNLDLVNMYFITPLDSSSNSSNSNSNSSNSSSQSGGQSGSAISKKDSSTFDLQQQQLVVIKMFNQLELKRKNQKLSQVDSPQKKAKKNVLVDRYEILKKIGKGGFGSVFKGKRSQIFCYKLFLRFYQF